jgi:TatD DNase family protein
VSKLFDTHAHMDDRRLQRDFDVMTSRLKKTLKRVLVPGIEPKGWQKILDICEDPFYIAALGIHPKEVDKIDEGVMERLDHLLRDPRVVALGEIGIDLHWRKDNLQEQIYWFRRQIRMAKEHKLPIILHDREAHGPLRDVLEEENPFETGVVLHAFSGSAEMAIEYVKKGAMISLAGPVTFQNAVAPKIVAEAVPLAHLLIETDSPYLTPHPFRGKRNDPAKVIFVAEEIARQKNLPVEIVIEQTTRNAEEIFGLAD